MNPNNHTILLGATDNNEYLIFLEQHIYPDGTYWYSFNRCECKNFNNIDVWEIADEIIEEMTDDDCFQFCLKYDCRPSEMRDFMSDEISDDINYYLERDTYTDAIIVGNDTFYILDYDYTVVPRLKCPYPIKLWYTPEPALVQLASGDKEWADHLYNRAADPDYQEQMKNALACWIETDTFFTKGGLNTCGA